MDCDGDVCGRSNPKSLQGSAVRKGKWCLRKGYRVPRGGRDQESAGVGDTNDGGRGETNKKAVTVAESQ